VRKEQTRIARLESRVTALEAALERARGVGDALRRVSMAVGTSVELDELLRLIVDAATEVLCADRATLYLREDELLISRVKKGDELSTIEVQLGQGIAGHVAKMGRPLRVADAYADARFDRSWDQKSGYTTRSILAAPMKSHAGDVIGVLQLLNKKGPGGEPQPFTPYDTELLLALATQAAVSIDKANLFRRLMRNMGQLEQTKERLERSLRDLELLYELETAMARSSTLEELAKSAIGLTARACGAAAGALLHASGGTLTMYLVNLERPDDTREVIVQPDEGFAARAMREGRLLRADNTRKLRDPPRVVELLGLRARSIMAAPLADGPHATGAICLYSADSDFDDGDAALLKLVSANVSTELRLFESRVQRERAERLGSIGHLLSGVMHDLRTPLSIISGYVQHMAKTDDATERAQQAREIAEQFEVINAMQRDLLAYARGETNLLVRKIFLGKFCEDLAQHFRRELQEKRIQLVVDVASTGVAYFDERRMARAIQNLMRNAIEAMDGRGGTLTLSCNDDGEDLVLSVADTGPGIPKAIRHKLFEPFVTSGKKTGTGLGLANVKKIAEEHGGHVEVESSRRGTTFTLRVPSAMRPHSLRPHVLAARAAQLAVKS